MGDRKRVYLAAPLFGLTERRTNRQVAEAVGRLLPDIEMVLPQDFKYHGRFNDARHFGAIFDACIKGVDSCHAVVALLDGCDADSGTCFEVGYAYAKGIPVIGVRTDYRANQEKGLNLMLSRGCTRVIWRPAFGEDMDDLCKDIARNLRRLWVRPNGRSS